MTEWFFATRPADQCQVTGKRSGIYYVGEALTFTFSKPAGLSTPASPGSYKVRDINGTVVRSGPGTGSALTVTPALPPGWYKLYLERAVPDANWGTNQGEYHFQVWRSTAGFVARPSGPVANGNRADNIDKGPRNPSDSVTRGLTLSGFERYNIENAADVTADLARAVEMHALDAKYYRNQDPARPKVQVCQFPYGTEVAGSAAGVTTVVNALGPIWYECTNEPDNAGINPVTFVAHLQRFHAMVKAANPNAKVLGPNQVTINANAANWLEQFLAAGGGQYLDGFSYHDYNSLNGDITLARTVYDRFIATLTRYNLHNLPRFMSEWGTFAGIRSFTPRRQARWWGMALLIWEQYGVPKERTFDFYQVSHGFGDYPSWNQTYDLSCFPIVTLQRVYSEEVFGKNYSQRLDFGEVENKHYVGNRYDGADGTKVLALISQGLTDGSVILNVTGATGLVQVDTWGVSSTVPVVDGRATVPVTELPSYVRLPAGVTATVISRVYGRNIAHDQSPATALSSGGAGTPNKVVDRIDESFYDAYSSLSAPFSDTGTVLPATLTVTMGKESTFDTVIVRCPPPWQAQGSLLDYDLQYLAPDGTTWVTLQTVVEPKRHFAINSDYYLGFGGYSETYWSERHTFVHRLGRQITSRKLRLYVRDCSKGGELDLVATTGDGSGDTGKYLSVREIEVYNVSQVTKKRYVGKVT